MPTSPRIAHAIEGYATWLRVERNLAPRTRKAYVEDLQRFERWLAETLGREEPTLDDVLADHLRNYLAHLRGDRSCKATTIGRQVSSLRGFFAFCTREGHLARDPAADLGRPRLAKKLPVYLVREEVERLFDAPDRSTPKGRRDHAILVTLAYTGLRLQELVGLDTRDVDFPRKTLRVFGKGRKERLVPMNARVAEVLEALLADPERVPATGERAVFLNLRGRRLTGRAVEYIVEECVRAAGIDKKRFSPHKLRHTFATLLHGNDVDLVDIQALMGHASLASTQIYTHTDTRRLKKTVDLLDFEE